jgi:parallel beta-helix repeat protein
VHLYGDDPVHPRIENNLIYGNAGTGILSDAKHEETDLFVVNNTVVGNGEDGVVFKRSAAQVRLTNNIVVDNGLFGLVCDGAEDPQASNNDLWDNASGNYDDCAIGIADISANPLLLDPAAGDFHLVFGSPCIDAGTSTDAPETDFDGIWRPQGAEVDIGAHEQGYWWIYLPLILRE